MLKALGVGGSGYVAPDTVLEGPSGVLDSDKGLRGLGETAVPCFTTLEASPTALTALNCGTMNKVNFSGQDLLCLHAITLA